MAIRICLDAGHGGKDPGAVNGNLRESIGTLQVVRQLGTLLQSTRHYLVQFTRTSDTYPSLTERCNISNNFNADAFISVHFNAASNKSASGIETLRYPVVGARTRELASNIQSSLISTLNWKDRGVKERSDLTVLKKTKAPAVLVECGFISNDEEASKLFNPDFQFKIADAIARGINKTFKVE